VLLSVLNIVPVCFVDSFCVYDVFLLFVLSLVVSTRLAGRTRLRNDMLPVENSTHALTRSPNMASNVLLALLMQDDSFCYQCTVTIDRLTTWACFCARQHIICYSAYMLSPVRLSVRPSVCPSVRHTGGSVKNA